MVTMSLSSNRIMTEKTNGITILFLFLIEKLIYFIKH